MRVLLFSTAYLPHLGGAELAIKSITDRLPEIEFDLITAKLKKGLKDFEKIGNINVHRIGAGNKFLDKPLLSNLGFLKALKLHKKKPYDLIYGVMASQGSAAAYLFKFFYPKVPFVLNLQEGDLVSNSPFDRFWQKRIIKKADVITVISGYLADFAKRYNKKAPIYIVPNGVNLESIEYKDLGIKNKKIKTIITISRLVNKNGIDILIKAFYILCSKFYVLNSELLIIGEGREKNKLEKLAEKFKISGKVSFLGSVPNDKINDYLLKADVFVRPSRSEGLGTAFLEAMAAGVPVIATPVGGIPDFLKDPSTNSGQATGLFCKVEDPQDLAEKIAMLLEDENLYFKLSKNGRKLVEEKYSWDKAAVLVKGIYEKTVNNYSGL